MENSSIVLQGLQVNGHRSPLGIDDPSSIRFTWQLGGKARGITVIESRVRVSTAQEQLAGQEPAADLWDSGWRSGPDQQADYAGARLKGNSTYWWKVFVRTSQGDVIESKASRFDTGLYAEDWRARWIWSSRKVRSNDFAFFRKTITVRKPVASAKLYVSAHHTAHVYLNGVKLGGYGSPAPSNPVKRKYYTAYDITEALTKGKHCVAAQAYYIGGSGQNYVDGLPGFRLQLELEYADGERESIITDRSWRVLKEIPYETGTPYQQNRRLSAIADYDAARLDPDWHKVGYDRTKCKNAVVARADETEWPMKWQEIAEGVIEERIVPADVTPEGAARETGEYRQVFDAGKIVSGWPYIRLKGIPGATVRLRYAEDVDEHGYVRHNVCNEKSENYYDQYTMRGDDLEEWQPDLSYKAFRFVEVTGYPAALVPGEQLWIISAHTDLGQQGSFRSSSDLLNRMTEACLQTQKNNTLGQITDCPHREQAQYLADSDLQAETLAYNFDSRHALEKVLSDFADGQKEDGTFPFVYPSNPEDPSFALQIPEWDLHYCTLLWKLYESTGDERVLRRYYEPAKRMSDYFAGLAEGTAEGLAPLDRGWHISDWPYPTVDHSSEILTVQNMKLFRALKIVSAIAGILGYTDEELRYETTAERLKENIRKHLFDVEKTRYRDCLGSQHTHQGVNGLAVHIGLVPEEERDRLLDSLAEQKWESKTVLSLPLLRAFFEHGQEEAAYRLIDRSDYPGWGYMISQGSPTMWEGWDDIESHSHAWNGYPLRLLQEYVAGIQSAAPGFAEVRIKPYMPEGLTYADATVQTVRGTIRVRWEKEPDQSRVMVELPVGTKASLILRMPEAALDCKLYENGAVVWAAEGEALRLPLGVESCQGDTNGRTLTIRLAGGSYDFTFCRS